MIPQFINEMKCQNNVNFNNLSEQFLGEFLGLFAGDGNLFKTKTYNYRSFLFFGPDEFEFMNKIKKLLTISFNQKPIEGKRKDKTGRIYLFYLFYCSKRVFYLVKHFLIWNKLQVKTYSVHLREENYSDQFKIGFLRGCFDSDGHISKKTIMFASVSKELIRDVTNFLDHFKIEYNCRLNKDKRSNRKDIYHIVLRKKHHSVFINLIEPRNVK